MYKPKSKAWFLRRVGKRIYRDRTTCRCSSCEDIYENGFIIETKEDAEYLAMIDWDFASSGECMNYRDTK